jgi:hypothetical protein
MFGYGRLNAAIRPVDDGSGSNANKRKRNRVNVVLLECDLGELLDLSLTGMRLRCKRRQIVSEGGSPISLMLRVNGAEDVVVKARAIWSKRCGITSHEVGLEFVDLDARQMAAISRLARDCSDCEVLRPRAAA